MVSFISLTVHVILSAMAQIIHNDGEDEDDDDDDDDGTYQCMRIWG